MTSDRLVHGVLAGLAGGVVFGLMMPMTGMMGMGPQLSAAGIQNAIPSLIGHIMFGLVAGATFAWLNARSLASEPVKA